MKHPGSKKKKSVGNTNLEFRVEAELIKIGRSIRSHWDPLGADLMGRKHLGKEYWPERRRAGGAEDCT